MPIDWEFTKRAFSSYEWQNKKKANIDFRIRSVSLRFDSIRLRLSQNTNQSYVAFAISRRFLFPFCWFSSFNRKQMVALFRLSPIQLTHCNLVCYTIVECERTRSDSYSHSKLIQHHTVYVITFIRTTYNVRACMCVWCWNVVTSIKLSEV